MDRLKTVTGEKKGAFIALESTSDDVAEAVAKNVIGRLRESGQSVLFLGFPQVNQPSSYFVKEYLIQGTSSVGPYTASLFYALDHYQAASKIRQAVNAGKVVIASHFNGYTMAREGSKFSSNAERRGYFIWNDNLEFEMLNVPRPDKSIVLRVPSGAKVEIYDDICRLFPKDFQQIDCARSGKLLSSETINNLVWESMRPLLPTQASSRLTGQILENIMKYYIPKGMSREMTNSYHSGMKRLVGSYREILDRLETYIGTQSTYTLEDAAGLVLPVAVEPDARDLIEKQSANVQKITDIANDLPQQFGQHEQIVRLSHVWPRNELDLVPQILYEYSDLSLGEIEQTLEKWPYEKKQKILEHYLKNPGDVLGAVSYTCDVVCELATLLRLKQNLPAAIAIQPLTVRYGYQVPSLIEQADLTEKFENCFDISLELYSAMQSAGYEKQAQYAVLLGNKVRCRITFSGKDIRKIHDLSTQTNSQLLGEILEKLAQTHPLLYDSFANSKNITKNKMNQTTRTNKSY